MKCVSSCLHNWTTPFSQLRPIHGFLVLDPFWRKLPFFIRTIHHEGRDDSRIFEPPHAEAGALEVATSHDLGRSARVAPELIRKIKNIREEIRYVNEWPAFSSDRAGPVLPL